MKKLFILLTIALPLAFVACGDDDDTPRPNISNDNINKNLGGVDKTVERIEMPHLNSRYDYICHSTSDGTVNYAMEYDKANLQARWVAYTYDNKTAQKNYSSRTDAWAPEPFYNNQKQYQVATGTFPGYNRGHIVGSAERYYSYEANAQTFYMSNMSPMLGDFNSVYWGVIEDMVRDNWGRNVTSSKSEFYKGTLYVVKGGYIDPNNKRTIDVYNTLGDKVKMTVPNSFWIACLYVSESGVGRGIAFWLDHKDYKNKSDSYLAKLKRDAAISIDELEKRTGIDFFCNLGDKVEEHIEAKCEPTSWPGL